MIWIVSKEATKSADELPFRHEFIEDVTQVRVSPWQERACAVDCSLQRPVEFYQCMSPKGEYGLVITAHIKEIPSLIHYVVTEKRAIIAINSCVLQKEYLKGFLEQVKRKNRYSELYYAKQKWYEEDTVKALVNFVDDVGSFGFDTTQSERELFVCRNMGLTKAIKSAFDKVVPE